MAKVLVPELRPGDIVIMDNLPGHKGPRVAELIEPAGASLLIFPPYSPDFIPFEDAFAKLKAHLRKAAEPTVSGAVGHHRPPYRTVPAQGMRKLLRSRRL